MSLHSHFTIDFDAHIKDVSHNLNEGVTEAVVGAKKPVVKNKSIS